MPGERNIVPIKKVKALKRTAIPASPLRFRLVLVRNATVSEGSTLEFKSMTDRLNSSVAITVSALVSGLIN